MFIDVDEKVSLLLLLNLLEFNIMLLLYFIVLRVKAMRPMEHRHNVQL